MHWDDLRFFLAVARLGQLSRASVVLGVDATTVGRRIRRLELRLEQRLFEQTRDGHVLTEAGEHLMTRAEAIEQSISEVESGPAGDTQLAGLIRISASEGFGTWLLAHHIGSFVEAYPGIRVDLVANNGFLSPSKREADVAILLARPRTGPLISKKVSDYVLRPYASHAYLQRHGPIRDVDALRSHCLIGYIPEFVYAPELLYMDEIAPDLEPTIRSSSINAQYRMAAAGVGVAVLPCFIGDADPSLARILPELHINRSFWLVTHQQTRQMARIQAFVEWITELSRQRRDRMMGNLRQCAPEDDR
ncbi:LysR family transcriptional regulator [Sphingosinicella rhizophila]|uniref:LysR family transcriptional regulator n=1 Tax=Sphingosinicella rhizophila TaxID=3050082 RepID=A0ABU3Q1Z8_9SPHN|nr:LysR family transcriptional regulator [Sphingosinicella sp. GR2756]MDT9597413.1 LysR family transcriptional regulator [Sphingosinicella sp. GR2756]